MRSTTQFYQSRHADWQRLDALTARHERGAPLTPAEIAEFARLYRAATADLALAQRDFPAADLTRYLNQLTARAHAALYRGEPFTLRGLRRFFGATLPRNFRATLPFTLLAALIFWAPAVLSGVITAQRPATAVLLLGPEMAETIEMVEQHEPWFYFSAEERPSSSALIMTNNIRVSILAFGGGMLAGLLTVYVLFFNGLLVGSLLGLAWHHRFFDLWHFVVGHGVIELSMICVAGGAGLQFAWAILHPTPYRRRDALRLAGQRALLLVVTVALFLVVAGLIEGFISPRPALHPAVKTAVGLGSGLLMAAYLLLAGRGDEQL